MTLRADNEPPPPDRAGSTRAAPAVCAAGAAVGPAPRWAPDVLTDSSYFKSTILRISRISPAASRAM